ncbi:MAG TPA: F0F1 ATP synthase subunit delta [Methanotrichaceae archaeon]|nr:F0F1 ATP synthase subunit delta [Methanotrichaceae archaeon]
MPLIDYFTTFAQIINFLVLVFLLRHFLYRPVIKAMDEREQKIATRLKEADQKKAEAEQATESYRKTEQELSIRRTEMMASVEAEVQAVRSDLMKKAREEVEASKASWFLALERQKEDLLSEMSRRAGDDVYDIARRALQDLASEDLEMHIIDSFIRRLQSLSDAEKKALREFSRDQEGKVLVRSAFDLPGPVRQKIAEAMRGLTGRDVLMQFESDKKLISGIELSANNIRIGWSIAGYLDDLRSDLSQAMEEKIAVEKAA